MNITTEVIDNVLLRSGYVISAPVSLRLIASMLARLGSLTTERGEGYLITSKEVWNTAIELPELKNLLRYEAEEKGINRLLGLNVVLSEALRPGEIYVAEVNDKSGVIVSIGCVTTDVGA